MIMKEVQNISEKSGVSKEYMLAFGTLDNYLRRVDKKEEPRWVNLAKNAFLHRPILKYSEYFPPAEYGDVITEKNKETIKKLNNIVDELNKMRENNQTDYEKLSPIWEKVNQLIFG